MYRLSLTRAAARFSQGRWDQAEGELRSLLNLPEEPGIMEPLARSLLARLLARRGKADEATVVLSPADASVEARDEIRVLGPVSIAMVEVAWLAGTSHDLVTLAQPALDLATRVGNRVTAAELSRYLQRAGVAVDPPPASPEPWASGLRGDWREAAESWAARGEPYERALDLITGDAAAVDAGRAILADLGATGVLQILDS